MPTRALQSHSQSVSGSVQCPHTLIPCACSAAWDVKACALQRSRRLAIAPSVLPLAGQRTCVGVTHFENMRTPMFQVCQAGFGLGTEVAPALPVRTARIRGLKVSTVDPDL